MANQPEDLKFYNFYFHEIAKPVTLEAYNRNQAREALLILAETKKLPAIYRNSNIVGESVTKPLFGISEKKLNGVKYVWVGNLSKNGWTTELEFQALQEKRKNEKGTK